MPTTKKKAKTAKPKKKATKTVKAPATKAAKKEITFAKQVKPTFVRQPGVQQYEKILVKMRDDLVNLVHHNQEAEIREDEVGDEADAARNSMEREILFELSDNERQSLDSIEAALRKIAQGIFGICEACNKKIAKLRLKALPHARYCITCQARFESR